MGKKKSVVLMTLLTIVIAVLCFITAFPSFVIPGTAKKWNPAVKQYDLSTDLGGGYYVYYYPEGVIPASEHESDLAALTEAVASAEAGEEQEEAQNELDEYTNAYAQVAGSNLWFSTDDALNIVVAERDEEGNIVSATITPNFQTVFDNAVQAITSRYQAKAYSDYRVAVVDGYAIRVELPRSENTEKASAVLTSFAKTGAFSLQKNGEVIDELKDSDASASDLIKKMSVKTMNMGRVAYLEIQFTKAGKEMLDGIKDSLALSTDAQNSNGSTVVTLDIMNGEEKIASIYKDNIMHNNTVRILPVDGINKDYVQTFEILMESMLADGEFDITFELGAVRTFAPLYSENVLTLLYIALGVAILAMLVLPIVKMGRFGGVSAYATLSYLIVTALCFAFITGGVFEVSLGTVLIFLAGLALVNVMQYHIYRAIKAEFNAGKTVESSVKGGYKKTLWTVVDVYVLAALVAFELLIGAAGVYTFALQAIICVVTAAFINLLWARFINFTYLSASKNKYKYFRFVREDDEDDE